MSPLTFLNGSQSSSKGFTLVEMMVVLLIAVVLTSIAVSSYGKYINKSKIRSAQTELMALSLSFENQYQRQLAYPNKTFTTTESLQTQFPAWASNRAEFIYSAVSEGSTYTITATAKNDNKLAGCVLTMTQSNFKQATNCQGVTW